MSIEPRERIINTGSSEFSQHRIVAMHGTTSIDIIGDAYPKNVTRKMTVPYRCMYIVRISVNGCKGDIKR